MDAGELVCAREVVSWEMLVNEIFKKCRRGPPPLGRQTVMGGRLCESSCPLLLAMRTRRYISKLVTSPSINVVFLCNCRLSVSHFGLEARDN